MCYDALLRVATFVFDSVYSFGGDFVTELSDISVGDRPASGATEHDKKRLQTNYGATASDADVTKVEESAASATKSDASYTEDWVVITHHNPFSPGSSPETSNILGGDFYIGAGE